MCPSHDFFSTEAEGCACGCSCHLTVHKMVLPRFRVVKFHPQVNLSVNTLMDKPRGVFSVVFESSQVNGDCIVLPQNHKRPCGKNGWSHLLSSHGFMLYVFEDRSVFTGENGMLVCLCLCLSSLRKKHVHFLASYHRSNYFPVCGFFSFTPNFLFFPNPFLLCSFSFQIVQTFPALSKAVGKRSLLTHLFPMIKSQENWQPFY